MNEATEGRTELELQDTSIIDKFGGKEVRVQQKIHNNNSRWMQQKDYFMHAIAQSTAAKKTNKATELHIE
jgi:hypothetical protein